MHICIHMKVKQACAIAYMCVFTLHSANKCARDLARDLCGGACHVA